MGKSNDLASSLTRDERVRYARQIVIPELGLEGQEKLRNAKVAVVGAGGLGSPVLLYLAAAGVGHLTVFDPDVVGISNLNRQILHDTDHIGKSKKTSTIDRLRALNPHVEVQFYDQRLDKENIELLKGHDFVIEGSDSLGTKFLVSDYCTIHSIAFAIGGVWSLEGQVVSHVPGTACYRCIFRDVPSEAVLPPCEISGMLGTVTGLVGSILAMEAIKYVTGIGELLTNKILHVDLSDYEFDAISIGRNPSCQACGNEADQELYKHYNYDRQLQV